jgi:hypothetical protein
MSVPDLVYVATYDERAVARFRVKDKEWQWSWYFDPPTKSVLYSPSLLKIVLTVPQLITTDLKGIVERTQMYVLFL